MNKEKISLNHKTVLQSRLRNLNLSISEYSFANIYLFRRTHQYELIQEEDFFIKGITFDGKSFLMPTSDVVLEKKELAQKLLTQVDFLFPIPEQWLSAFDPQVFNWESNPAESDYLIKSEKLSRYPGRKLFSKRNQLKQFITAYHVSEDPIKSENIVDAESILRAWSPERKGDYDQCLEALSLLSPLELFGKIIYASGMPAGFIIGERVSERLVIIHFLKANVIFKGVYSYILHSFAQEFESHNFCINMEQDLGLESLRKSKLSYQPDKILPKWRISLKKPST